MRHLRADYNRIQDPHNKIGSDEPVFLLRAQDKAFPRDARRLLRLSARGRQLVACRVH